MKRDVEVQSRIGNKYLHYAGYLNFWLVLIFLGTFGVYFIATPKCSDDYWYMMLMKPWFEFHGVTGPGWNVNIFTQGLPVQEILSTWEWRFYNDNIRLANCIGTIFLIFPKWLGSGLSLLALGYAVVRGFRLINVDWLRSPLVGFALVLYYFALPWWEQMGSLIYQFNYIIPTGLCVWLLVRIENERNTTLWNIGTFLTALLVGAWHEGFSVPVLAAISVMMLFRKYRTLSALSAIAGLIIGIIFIFSSPAIRERGSDNLTDNLNLGFFTHIIISEWSCMLAILLSLAVVMMKRKILTQTIGSRILTLLLIIIFSLGVYVFVPLPRVTWIADFFSVPVSIGCLSFLLNKIIVKKRDIAITTAMVMLLPVYVSLFLACRETFILRDVMNRTVRTLAQNPEKTYVFGNIRNYSRHSVLLNRFPAYRQYRMFIYLSHFFTLKDDGPVVAVIPEELRHYTYGAGQTLAGNGNVKEYAGEYVTRYDGPFSGSVFSNLEIDFGKGYVGTTVRADIFISSADGNKYMRLDPYFNPYLTYFKKIKGIRNIVPVPPGQYNMPTISSSSSKYRKCQSK
ncbi:MAG: hypothetical protein HDS16_01005 [Bacteroides sp.]|nr:hypothetical protein [Bacteroides sp.]